MQIDGAKIMEGSEIQNLTVASGSTFPDIPNKAELFYLDTIVPKANGQFYGIGLYCNDGIEWILLSTEVAVNSSINSLASIPTNIASGTSFAVAPVDGELFYKTISDITGDIGLYVFLLSDSLWHAVSANTQLANHLVDQSLHLTSSQNTWIDAVTASSTEVNYLSGVTSSIQSQLDSKATASSLATVATSGSYTDLINKPTIPTVPTILSSFTNDSGYQTLAQVNTAIQTVVGAAPTALDTLQEIATQLAADESVVSALTTAVSDKASIVYVDAQLALKANKTQLFSGSYTDLINKPTIPTVPTAISSFTNDSNYQTATQVSATLASSGLVTSSGLATVATSGSYTDLINKPTNVSVFANDVGYLTAINITNKADKAITLAGYGITDTYTKTEVNTSLSLKADQSYVLTNLATKEDIAKLSAVAESGSYLDLHDKPFIPTLVSDLTNNASYQNASQVTNAITAANLANVSGSQSVDFNTKNLIVNGNIMPAVTGVSTIGSATDKFAAIYTKEMHIDANTLYVDGVAVLGSSANTIQITADVNQGIRVATTGTGETILDSQAATKIQTSGTNADVLIQTNGLGSTARITSSTQVVLTAPTIAAVGNQTISGDLIVSGSFTVAGTQTVVNSTQMTVKDNIITLNKGEISDGITLDSAGIEIDRGALARQRLVFKQSVNKWLMGAAGSEIAIASEDYVASGLSSKVNSASLATVATSGSYTDLIGKPTLFSGAYVDLTGKPTALSSFTNDSNFATTSQVTTAIQSVVGAAPATLNTLAKIATQLVNDELVVSNLSTTVDSKASTTYVDNALLVKADKSTTYTKSEVDAAIAAAIAAFAATLYV